MGPLRYNSGTTHRLLTLAVVIGTFRIADSECSVAPQLHVVRFGVTENYGLTRFAIIS